MTQTTRAAALLALALGTVSASCGQSVLDSSSDASIDRSITFDYAGSPQAWTVPEGVEAIEVDVRGAQGGGHDSTEPGGKGGRVRATLAVTPGETLIIRVGGAGGDHVPSDNAGGEGGWNGGGAGGMDPIDFNGPAGGGGGASDIRRGGDTLGNRMVVAGGGGGSDGYHSGFGGEGGGVAGATGRCSGDECDCASAGLGGTQVAGGRAGYGCNGNGRAGKLGQGGLGGNGNRAGGGGGGGYYGGGGGGGCCLGAGGGGGSSYSIDPAAQHTRGVQTGNGQVLMRLL